jgi:hypothetical protein
VVYLQVIMFAVWAIEQVLKWTSKEGAMPANCRPHFAYLMHLCEQARIAGIKEGIAPSSLPMVTPPMFASDSITDRESLRRAVVAGDDKLISGFLSARFLSDEQKKVLESGMSVVQEDQEPTNGFLDEWLMKFLAM